MKITVKLLKHRKRRLGLVILIMDGLFFGTTDPSQVASPLLAVAFLLLSLNLFYFAYIGLHLAVKAGFSMGSKQYKAAFGVAGVMALLVALKSVGQLGVHDIAVLLPLAVLGYIYVTYAQPVP